MLLVYINKTQTAILPILLKIAVYIYIIYNNTQKHPKTPKNTKILSNMGAKASSIKATQSNNIDTMPVPESAVREASRLDAVYHWSHTDACDKKFFQGMMVGIECNECRDKFNLQEDFDAHNCMHTQYVKHMRCFHCKLMYTNPLILHNNEQPCPVELDNKKTSYLKCLATLTNPEEIDALEASRLDEESYWVDTDNYVKVFHHGKMSSIQCKHCFHEFCQQETFDSHECILSPRMWCQNCGLPYSSSFIRHNNTQTCHYNTQDRWCNSMAPFSQS